MKVNTFHCERDRVNVGESIKSVLLRKTLITLLMPQDIVVETNKYRHKGVHLVSNGNHHLIQFLLVLIQCCCVYFDLHPLSQLLWRGVQGLLLLCRLQQVVSVPSSSSSVRAAQSYLTNCCYALAGRLCA